LSNLKVKKSSFYPVGILDGKNNFKRFFRIEEDGAVTERVFLDVVDSSERERIICLHYMRHIIRHFQKEQVGINIIGRDNPWDFNIELSTGITLNVEITSIADMKEHFIINKGEERYSKWAIEELIPLHELMKINCLFPNIDIGSVIKGHLKDEISKNSLVTNPFLSSNKNIFVSKMPKCEKKLAAYIKEVITKKEQKNHPEKSKTVLIIDNRTSMFEVTDYIDAAEEINEFCQSTSFPEIWFYTGYCSDNSGNNAEFSFAPLKVTNNQQVILEKMAVNTDVDKNGRLVW
jgi:hypothetical protein